jgi:hypothetical protein
MSSIGFMYDIGAFDVLNFLLNAFGTVDTQFYLNTSSVSMTPSDPDSSSYGVTHPKTYRRWVLRFHLARVALLPALQE